MLREPAISHRLRPHRRTARTQSVVTVHTSMRVSVALASSVNCLVSPVERAAARTTARIAHRLPWASENRNTGDRQDKQPRQKNNRTRNSHSHGHSHGHSQTGTVTARSGLGHVPDDPLVVSELLRTLAHSSPCSARSSSTARSRRRGRMSASWSSPSCLSTRTRTTSPNHDTTAATDDDDAPGPYNR